MFLYWTTGFVVLCGGLLIIAPQRVLRSTAGSLWVFSELYRLNNYQAYGDKLVIASIHLAFNIS